MAVSNEEPTRSGSAVEKSPGSTPPSTRKSLLVVLYVLSIVVLLVNPFVRYAFFETCDTLEPDWAIFYPAAQKLASDELPYPPEWGERKPREPVGKGWKDYIYPPTFARLLIPLTYLGPFWSMKAYLFICLSLYCLLLFPRYKHRPYGWVDQGVALAFFFGWGPIIQDFRHGQTDFIPLFLFALSWKLLRQAGHPAPEQTGRRKEMLAGLLLGFSYAIKLTPVLILPVLVVSKRWRVAAASVAGALTLLIVTGPFVSFHYFTRVLPTMLADFSGMYDRPVLHLGIVSLLNQFAGRSGQPGELASGIGIAVSGMVFLGILFVLWRRRDRIPTADLILLGCFLPPLFAGDLNHHYVLTLLPLMVTTRNLIRSGAVLSPARLSLLVALAVVLAPSFYYWAWVRWLYNFVEGAIGLTLNMQILFGNLIAFFILLPILVGRSTEEKSV